MTDNDYRSCCGKTENGNCPYMRYNEYGVETCSIDGIVQVRWYGCTPADVRRGDK